MEIKQLEVFTKLYELKSFSKVARELNISQPTVTMQLKQLEEELNTVLFARTTREIKETPDAVRLYSMAVEMLNYRDKLLNQFNDNVIREISIGASLLPAHFILPEIMEDLKNRHSASMIKAVEGVTPEIVSKVADKELDIGIIGTL
ncbi:MAG: LysR family transcriptional regulator, partial [Clostridiaceae bacterium]